MQAREGTWTDVDTKYENVGAHLGKDGKPHLTRTNDGSYHYTWGWWLQSVHRLRSWYVGRLSQGSCTAYLNGWPAIQPMNTTRIESDVLERLVPVMVGILCKASPLSSVSRYSWESGSDDSTRGPQIECYVGTSACHFHQPLSGFAQRFAGGCISTFKGLL